MSKLTIRSNNQIANSDEIAAARAISDLANKVAAKSAFWDYQQLKSAATLEAHRRDLALFAGFINSVYERTTQTDNLESVTFRLSDRDLYENPEAWIIASHGLVKLFKNYLADNGFALSSINRALSTVRKYASLAMEADVISPLDLAQIKNVNGFRHSESKNVDEKRARTRIGKKKVEAVPIPLLAIQELKNAGNYPQTAAGRRDLLVLTLFLDHGLRASEVAGLKVGDADLSSGEMSVYRKKTKSTDLIQLTHDSYHALRNYLENDGLPHPSAPLLRTSNKSGRLSKNPMTRITVSRLVNKYGKKMADKLGIPELRKLSAHDGRHQWATDALEAGTPLNDLQQAGGWKSPAMPLRYANKSKIANKGVKLNR
ncbi:MAG: tyrosine-type recombinase/integrase [Chloroflexota bacterium]